MSVRQLFQDSRSDRGGPSLRGLEQELTLDVLAREIKLDAQDLEAYSAIVQDLRQIGQDKRIQHLSGNTLYLMHYRNDQAKSEGTFSTERAKKFKEYFDSEEKTRVFSRYQRDGEWSKDAKTLKNQS